MSRNLVIVESPAKAKTIEKFLGKEFKVASSFGHISDLPSNELGVNIDNNFSPKYIVTDDKKKIVSENVILLQPTSPFRNDKDILKAIKKYEKGNHDSLFSAYEDKILIWKKKKNNHTRTNFWYGKCLLQCL